MNILQLKEKLAAVLPEWVDSRIEQLATDNPTLKIASVYLKRGAGNYIRQQHARIDRTLDTVAMFIADENGNINADTITADIMTLFRDMEEMPYSSGFIHGTIGKGTVRFAIPDNPISNIIFGNTNAIIITDKDILELLTMLK